MRQRSKVGRPRQSSNSMVEQSSASAVGRRRSTKLSPWTGQHPVMDLSLQRHLKPSSSGSIGPPRFVRRYSSFSLSLSTDVVQDGVIPP